jgi:hypothetical protein
MKAHWDVKQVALSVIDFLQIGIVANRLDALLRGDDLIVAGHYRYCTRLQPFCEVHGADRQVTAGGQLREDNGITVFGNVCRSAIPLHNGIEPIKLLAKFNASLARYILGHQGMNGAVRVSLGHDDGAHARLVRHRQTTPSR